MDEIISNRLKARAAVLKAMAHPTRLFMLEQLGKNEMSVGELTELVGLDMSTVSRHLALLKSEGIISDRKKGTRVYYYLECPCVLNFYQCVDGVLKSNSDKKLQITGQANV